MKKLRNTKYYEQKYVFYYFAQNYEAKKAMVHHTDIAAAQSSTIFKQVAICYEQFYNERNYYEQNYYEQKSNLTELHTSGRTSMYIVLYYEQKYSTFVNRSRSKEWCILL